MTKTFSAKAGQVKQDWFVVDASGKILGRLASEIALRLQGALRFRQIAELQGVPIKTVLSRYRCGLGKLRSLLNGEVTQCDCLEISRNLFSIKSFNLPGVPITN